MLDTIFASPRSLSTSAIRGRSALEQAALVRRGEVSAEELARTCLDAIVREDARVGAFAEVLHAQALHAARAADRLRRRRGEALPPFLGVPIALSDAAPTRGSLARLGSRALERLFPPLAPPPPLDDPAAARLRLAGFVIVGKTTARPLCGDRTDDPREPREPPEPREAREARDPWDLDVTAGGSSGGAAAAVAAAMVPIAHACDAAGSIRLASSFCHVVGLKPSRGRVASPYAHDDGAALHACGALARTVDDCAALLDVMAGIGVGKPHWAPPPPRPFLELARAAVRPLRVRVCTSAPFADAPPEIVEAVRDVARALASRGHHVDEATEFAGAVDELAAVIRHAAAEVAAARGRISARARRVAHRSRADDAARDDATARAIARASRHVLERFGDADVWLTPTTPLPPPRLAAWRSLDAARAIEEEARLCAFTAPFNASGQPAATVPAGVSRAGHPIGVQVVGRPMADATVLAVCKQIEEALPWGARCAALLNRAGPLSAARASQSRASS